jgi:pyruvate formate lyase activating enzyme
MSEDTGRIFNIQKFSIHDGPGIRTVVFFKGCPMSCQWCSNPNSRTLDPVLMRDANDANVFAEDSRSYSLDEVVSVCLQDLPFYEESCGGVTLSGGEALVQHRFSIKLLKRLRSKGIHTAIETTGYVAPPRFAKALAQLDLLIIDVKHHNKDQHKRWTTVSHDLPLQNLTTAIKAGGEVWVRIPVIPGVNNSLDDARAFCELLRPIGVTKVQLLPFHQFGERKYELLNWDYNFAGVPSLHEDELADYRQAFDDNGVHASF